MESPHKDSKPDARVCVCVCVCVCARMHKKYSLANRVILTALLVTLQCIRQPEIFRVDMD